MFVAVQGADAKKTKKKPQRHGTGERVNRMSDLISRKALLEALETGKDKVYERKTILEVMQEIVKNQPTAFDKERVIAKIDNASMSRCRYGFRNFDLSPKCCIDCQKDFIRAVYEIVEKGGIE